ncbi:TonB-dependent receptor [Flavobacterium ardleyense]|uniref:TonB-dependent receptor n=1 Tax=Flavobacterium ardleyense TaxID=2038737 RepID=UPI00298C67E9|nr:TonB-dependent receptor [Flavobacterium ardleyense]
MKYLATAIFALATTAVAVAQQGTLKGHIFDSKNEPISLAKVKIEKLTNILLTDKAGEFTAINLPYGMYTVMIDHAGFESKVFTVNINRNITTLNITLSLENSELKEVEVFGRSNIAPEKLETLTRLPLQARDQIQSISVISSSLIQKQGALTINDATRNVPGVYAFATYGNKRESMASRGYRGIPILKNGVRVNSDFRGTGILTDAAGIDNIQVLKGVSAITQGVATDIGSPGGVINIVTKTPNFYSGGEVSLRSGSWGQVRPQFDFYGPMDKEEKVAFRIAGAYETKDSYRSHVNSDKIYVNPSIAWKANDKTTLTFEMDYLDDNRTPDLGTINIGESDVNGIYDLPHNKFLGYTNDKTNTINTNYTVRFDREINEKLSVRAAYFKSDLATDDVGAALASKNNLTLSQRNRSLSHSTRKDINQVLQLDLVAKDIYTGSIKHLFQVGFDYNRNTTSTLSEKTSVLDVIDVYQPINNYLPETVTYGAATTNNESSKGFGVLAQGVTEWTKWFRTFVGLRYSKVESIANINIGVKSSNAVNPLAGVMFIPTKNVNLFASYTNSSNPRSATREDINGNALGNERWDQWEAGWKTSWLDDRLRFNTTFFKINNRDMNLPVYDNTWTETGYYQKGGNDQRQGIETELSGRVLKNLEVIFGYSFIDAKYKEHTSYVYNSAPLNTPKHTANAWANYKFLNNSLEGLSVGVGVYYLGDRPVNDWSKGPITHEGIVPNVKPFDLAAYTTVNFQVGYKFNENWKVLGYVNNAFNEFGYNAYRTSYINPIDPINFSGMLIYHF